MLYLGYLISSACPYEVGVFTPILQMEKFQLSVSQGQRQIFNPSNNSLNLRQLEPEEDRPVSFMNIECVT